MCDDCIGLVRKQVTILAKSDRSFDDALFTRHRCANGVVYRPRNQYLPPLKRLVREAAEQGADWVLLPEYWPLMGKNDTDKLAFAEPLDDGRVVETCHTRFRRP